MKKQMIRTIVAAAILSMVLVVSGCGYGEYMQRSSIPTLNATQTVTRYDAKAYDVLGLVRAEGNSRCILGIVVEGVEGEALLWDAAKSQFGDRVTGIKDINISYDYQSILPPIFSEITTTYVGTAVHEN